MQSGYDYEKKRLFGSSSMHDEVIVHKSDYKSYSKQSRAGQYRMKKILNEKVYDLFNDYALDTDAARLNFVASLEKDILQGRERVQSGAVEKQVDSLPLTKRNELLKLLTHRSNGVTQCLNENVLALFPTLRKRSIELLNQNERKERVDKINLNTISRYMHDYCRYVNTQCHIYII
jgi:hypothetical protein